MNAATPWDRLLAAAGVATHNTDGRGKQRAVSIETQRALLAAMDLLSETPEQIEDSLARLDRGDGKPLPTTVILHETESGLSIPLSSSATSIPVEWAMRCEDGTTLSGAVTRPEVTLAALPLGYHDLTIQWRDGKDTRDTRHRLIVVPARCYTPPSIAGNSRRWGIAAQLYALRSARNWGIGDFTDLIALLRMAGHWGAACVALNPLHALSAANPGQASPYSPSSRIFLNPLYIDVEAVEEYRDCIPAQRLVASEDFQAKLAVARAASLINYQAVASCKYEVLALLHRTFHERRRAHPTSSRAKAFDRFVTQAGEALHHFARRQESPDGDAAFHIYLQWQAESQLLRAKDVASRTGLSIGIGQDLAVAAARDSDAATVRQTPMAPDMRLGAPPDALNPESQDWGLVPSDPLKLRPAGYEPFIAVLRAQMARGGCLRIDHIFGLARQSWIPDGHRAEEGGYIAFPWTDLAALIALESQRNRCMVIGEDLGTVPPGFRDAMTAMGILSSRVFHFQKDEAGWFLPPESYPSDAVVTVSTHDLPTLAGFMANADNLLRDQLDLWPTPQSRALAIDERQADLAQLHAISAAADSRTYSLDHTVDALYGHLSRAPSRLLLVRIEDIVGQVEQVNLPGTSDAYPNWRHRLPVDLEALAQAPRPLRLARRLADRADRPLPMENSNTEIPAIPIATYRLQFGPHADFDDAARIAPYLAGLGISHLYASPWLEARGPESHGYDITDYNSINPLLGGQHGFDHLAATLSAWRLGHIADFVPNHMGVGKTANPWWNDVLEWGLDSRHASHFDIDWQSPHRHLRDKIDIPILGKTYGHALEDGEFVLRFDPGLGRFAIWYHDHRFPIDPRDYPQALRRALSAAQGDRERFATLAELNRQFEADGSHEDASTLEARLAELALSDSATAEWLRLGAESFTGTQGDRESLRPLHELLDRQHYCLSYWRTAPDDINYRHFFNIADLAGIRIEDQDLFGAVHDLMAQLLQDGKLSGLRIDHIDGLHDPAEYCARLRDMVSRTPRGTAYLVVEKILAEGEALPEEWPVAGTTGYDFMAQVSALLVDPAGKAPLTRFYQDFTGRQESYPDLVQRSRHYAVATLFKGELESLSRALQDIAVRDWLTRDFTMAQLREALHAVLCRFPVYRSYVTEHHTSDRDRAVIARATDGAKQDRPELAAEGLFDFVAAVLTGDHLRSTARDPEVIRFATRFQQISGPISAKGIEDTAFYRYNRLIALNEVGGDPELFGLDAEAFHRFNGDHAAHWPHAMLASATHDTKRGEDARARLTVLSEIPSEWRDYVRHWSQRNRAYASVVPTGSAPDPNDEYLLYQTLIGAWPIELFGEDRSAAALAIFSDRVKAFMRKAVREGGEHSSWAYPDTAYEEALNRFIDQVLDGDESLTLSDIAQFAERVAGLGVANSLAQLVLKCTCPGLPDIYQGTELWDLALVDPDNRRAIDFAARTALVPALRAIAGRSGNARITAVEDLAQQWRDGRIKFFVLLQLLALRQAKPDLFTDGSYEPLAVGGAEAGRVIAFRRTNGKESVIVLTGRHLASSPSWGDTAAAMPPTNGRRWRNIFDGRDLDAQDSHLDIGTVLRSLPVAVLVEE